MSVIIANSTPPVAVMDMTSDMFPQQFQEHVISWNECMRFSAHVVQYRPDIPQEWCTECWPSWLQRGWCCYECENRRGGLFDAPLPDRAPHRYRHCEVRRVFRFLETPGYSDIHVFNWQSNRWEYVDFAGRIGGVLFLRYARRTSTPVCGSRRCTHC